MQYLNPPKGVAFGWPTDIAENDTQYIRMYIKWRYPDAFEPQVLPVASRAQLVEYLTDKGYSFGLPLYADQDNMDDSNA